MTLGILILRDDLDRDVRVIRLSQILDIEIDHVIGKLWRFWRAAKIHTSDGNLVGFTADTIDGIAECYGFAEAMVRVGWLKLHLIGAQIPNFEEWCSPEAMKALLKKATRPEEDHPGFEEFWAKYPRKEDKRRARACWNKLKPTGDLLRKIMDGLERWNNSCQWAREKVIPHPGTWLNNWRWEDEIHAGKPVGGAGRVVGEAGKYAAFREGGADVPPAATG